MSRYLTNTTTDEHSDSLNGIHDNKHIVGMGSKKNAMIIATVEFSISTTLYYTAFYFRRHNIVLFFRAAVCD